MRLKRGSTSVRRLIFIGDSSSTTGAGLAGLVHSSSGLVCWYFAGDLSASVQVTLASSTLGTFTSGGFVAVDNTNMPGWYEIGIPNAALDGGNEVSIQLRGAADMVPVNIYIELTSVDYQDSAAFGLSRVDAAVSSRLATSSYTAPDNSSITAIKAKTDNLPSDPADASDVASSFSTVNSTLGAIIAYIDTEIGAIKSKTDTIPTWPTNFASLAISVGGAVTAGTVSDKTGYSLSQSFPSNFASLSVDGSGRVLLQPTQTGVTIPTVTALTNTVTVGTNNDKTGYALTSGERSSIADSVWDEATSGHTTSGTTGAAIVAAGSAGDPWSASLPGAYGAGTAGYIVGTNIDAAISSRSTLDASSVWSAGSRTITGGTVTTVSDKTGYSLTQAFPANFASFSIDASGRVLLQPTQTGVTIPTVTSLTNTVVVGTNNDKTGYSLATSPPTAATIASQVRTELNTELGRIDAAVSSRLASAAYVAPDNSGISTIGSTVAATKSVTDKLNTMLVVDGLVYQYTANSLELGPAGGGGGGGSADWTSDERTAIRSILGVPASGSAPETPVAGILADVYSLVSGGEVTSIAPVTSSGTINGPIVIGDDYFASSDRAFDWFVDPGAFDIDLSTCWFGGSSPSKQGWKVAGTVEATTVSGQPKWRLRFELNSAATSVLQAADYKWSVELRGPNPEHITKIRGTVSVVDSYTR